MPSLIVKIKKTMQRLCQETWVLILVLTYVSCVARTRRLPSLSYLLMSALPSGGYRKGAHTCCRMGSGFALCSSAGRGPNVLTLKQWPHQERWAGSSGAPRADAHCGFVEQDGPGHVFRSCQWMSRLPITGGSSGPQSASPLR